MANMGLNQVADDLGIRLSYFEEEDWVTVRPVMRTHDDATFMISQVGRRINRRPRTRVVA
jgi:hypothetical protein